MVKGYGLFRDGYLVDFSQNQDDLPAISNPDEEHIAQTEVSFDDAYLFRTLRR